MRGMVQFFGAMKLKVRVSFWPVLLVSLFSCQEETDSSLNVVLPDESKEVGVPKLQQAEIEASKAMKITRVRLQMIHLRLDEYANENNGVYPVGNDSIGTILYQILSGDYTGLGEPPTGSVYWPELNEGPKSGLVGIVRGKRAILDGYGQPFRYRSARDENGNPVPNLRNDGHYDLWSIGPDGLPADVNVSGVLFSEETQDDIWR